MVALVALIFQGNEQILATDSVPLLVSALETIGNNETWDVFVFSHSFRHVDRPIVPNVRLNLNIISQSDCRDHYRFDQDELRQIIPLLPFPEYIITPAGDKAHIIEAFCLVLRRMANRGKMKDYVKDFGRTEGSLC